MATRDRAGDDARSSAASVSPPKSATPRAAKGALLIPAFAVERTQELIVDLVDLMERGEIPAAPIFLDSPLAIRATEVFRHMRRASIDVDVNRLLSSPHLRFTETVDESKAIAKLTGFHIIIAASGMCDAGRIRHHLKRWLWNARATVLLVGFQAQGTLGRFLQDGAKAVRIQGEEIRVAARIRMIDEYSGHADGAGARAMDRGAPADSSAGCSWCMARSRRSPALPNASPSGSFRPRKIFQPVLDDIYELSTPHRAASMSTPPPARARGGRRISTGTTTCRASSSTSTIASGRRRRPRPRRHHPAPATRA